MKKKSENDSTVLKILIIAFSVLFALMWCTLWDEILHGLHIIPRFPLFWQRLLPPIVSMVILVGVYLIGRRLIYGSFWGRPSIEVEEVAKKK